MEMVEVSKDTFFRVIGPLDVHPKIISSWSDKNGYHCDWNLRNGGTIGQTDGIPTRYLLSREYVE